MIKRWGFILLAGALLFIGYQQQQARAAQQELTRPAVPVMPVMYYFHTDVRCISCMKIEEYTTAAYNENFKDKLELRIVNVQDASNEHFINDYQLYSKSVVVVNIKDGKETGYKNLDKVWLLLGDEEQFKAYIKKETEAFLAN